MWVKLSDAVTLTSEEALSNLTGDGRIVSVFAPLPTGSTPSFALPLFNQSGFDFYEQIDNLNLGRIEERVGNKGQGDATTLADSGRKEFDGNLFGYVQLGLNYQDTDFESDLGDFFSYNTNGATVPLSSIGLGFQPGILTSIGAVNDFSALDRHAASHGHQIDRFEVLCLP